MKRPESHRPRGSTGRYYAFGPFVLDTLRGLLWQDGVSVALTPKALELLALMVQHGGELLRKDDLLTLIWPGSIVEESNLARHISTLRRALHERPGQREYIVTVPGVGYRFVADVTELESLPENLIAAHAPKGNHNGHPTPVTPLALSELPTPPAAPPPVAAPARVGLGRVERYAAIGALALGVITLLIWIATSSDEQPSVQRSLRQFTYDSGLQQDPAWSPDGARIAFASDRAGSSDVWVQTLGESDPVRLTSSPAHDWQPNWSPDGQALAFRSERDGGGLYIVPVEGGIEQRLTTFGARPRWSPSGGLILFSRSAPDSAGAIKMYVVGRNGGAPRAVEHEFLAGLRAASAEWHPDGRVSFWGRDEADQEAFVTVPVDRGRAARSAISRDVRDRLARAGLTLSNFVWAPDGRCVYFEGRSQLVRNIWRVTVDPTTLAWVDGPERLTTGPGSDAGLSISPDGRRLTFGVSSGRVVLKSFEFDPASGKLMGPGQVVTRGETEDNALDASRDGQKLVFRTLRNDRQELWEQSSKTGPRLLLSTTEWSHSPPRWSPDGTRVAYQRSRKNLRGPQAERVVSILAVRDLQEQSLTVPGGDTIIPADWSDDGTSILAACRLALSERVGTCRLSASGSRADQVVQLSQHEQLDMFQQRFSPDQRWVSFIGVPSGDRSLSAVYVMPAQGGPWTAITDGDWYDDKPRWAPDGRTIYFISNRDGRPEVWGRRFDQASGQPAGSPFRVTNFQGSRQALSPYLSQMDMVVTAQRIFLPIYEASGQVWVLEDVDR